MNWPALSSNTLTSGVRIKIQSRYLPGKSDPVHSRFLFAYDVSIINEGPEAVQLISRYWKIRDAFGRIEEVRGPGVVGQQPLLSTGAQFQYTSYCPLPTSNGTMEGYFRMTGQDSTEFDAIIQPFQLIAPQALN